MKSVCILVQNHYDMDIRVRRKAEALVGAGYSVDVLALRPASSGDKSYVLNDVQVHTLSLGRQRGSLGRYAFEYLTFLVLVSVKLTLLSFRRAYAVIDVNNLPDFLVFAALPAEMQKIQEDYSPAGALTVSHRYRRDAGGPWRKTWTFRPEGMAGEFRLFRYKVERITGVIERTLYLPGGGQKIRMRQRDGLF